MVTRMQRLRVVWMEAEESEEDALARAGVSAAVLVSWEPEPLEW